MKHLFTLTFLVTLLLGLLPTETVAENPNYTYTFTLYRMSSNNDDSNNGGQNRQGTPEGKRKPSRPIECSISKEAGIMIYGASDEIVSYEIWDTDGNCCLSLSYEESDFLNDLFSFSGDFQIRFNSADYTYVGYLSTTE